MRFGQRNTNFLLGFRLTALSVQVDLKELVEDFFLMDYKSFAENLSEGENKQDYNLTAGGARERETSHS